MMGPLAIDLVVYGTLAALLFAFLLAAAKLPTGDDLSDPWDFREPIPKVFDDESWPQVIAWYQDDYRARHRSTASRAA